jgi:hypothetical protein
VAGLPDRDAAIASRLGVAISTVRASRTPHPSATGDLNPYLQSHPSLLTGLGTPVANLFVPDLVAYNGPGTAYAGAKVGPLQNATLSSTWTSGGSVTNAFNVFSALTGTNSGLGHAQASTTGTDLSSPTTPGAGLATPLTSPSAANHPLATTPATAAGSWPP